MLLNIRAGEVPLLIRKTAEEITGAFYDMNRTEQFRQYAGTQRRFVRQAWKDHIQTAIDNLTTLLAQEGTSEYLKADIYDAIVEYNKRLEAKTPKFSTRTLQ